MGQQLGQLFLQAVPIVVILLIFYGILKVLFFQPLLKVIAEREARTIGAQKAAEEAQKAAAEKTQQYQDAIKQARSQVYAEQEAARKKAMDERAGQLKEARAQAAKEVSAAKTRIEQETASAKNEIQGSATALAALVARRVLQASRPPSARPRESR
jgi:F-type H+-transporting ATPase subunit b